ncbi:MAG TPA: four helix bundle protein [Dehalococcoidia bacterium]|nr:four helix bundle protein [Dehalococcoidia bacterium]
MVEGVSNLLKQTIEETKLDEDKEWVLEVIREAAEMLPASIIEGQESEYLAEFILGVSAARNAAVIAAYCFNFLRGEGLMDASKADDIEAKLDELELALGVLTDTLRRDLSNQRRFANN